MITSVKSSYTLLIIISILIMVSAFLRQFSILHSSINVVKYNCRPCTVRYLFDKKFYESIGSPRFISAPMVDQSSHSFRSLVGKYNVDLVYTPMFNAKIFISSKRYRDESIDWMGNGSNMHNNSPLIAQLAGDDPEVLVSAGKFLEDKVSAIDLNLGCPQNIARKGHYGAFLLEDPDLIKQILLKMVEKLGCPITVKIRKLSSDEETIRLCKLIESCGVSMITVHGRTKDSSKSFTGPADWNIIRSIKNELKIPVIANGGISNLDDALRCLQQTGADGVMSSEALLENPSLFSVEGDYAYRFDYVKHQISIAKELIRLFYIYNPLQIHQLRGHLFKILYRILNATENIPIRDQLSVSTSESIFDIIYKIEEKYSNIFCNENVLIQNGLLYSSSWYSRHRDQKPQDRKRNIRVTNDLETVDKLKNLKERLEKKFHRNA